MSTIIKQYTHNGLSGCVTQYQNTDAGIAVGLYCAQQAGIDADHPWVTVCERHHTMCSHATLGRAKQALALVEWCEACQSTDMLKVVRLLDVLARRYYQAQLFVGRDRAHALRLARRWSLNGLRGCIFSTGDQRESFQSGQLVKKFDMYFQGESALLLRAARQVGLRAKVSEAGSTGFALLTISPRTLR